MADTIEPSLVKWLEQQLPRTAKKVSLKKLDSAPLHISDRKIPVFTPRIPYSVYSDEDKTVPRICCSVDLERCLRGVRRYFTPAETANVVPRFYLYGFDERDVVQPSIELSAEPYRANEVWIVPHRLSNWEIKPSVVGELRLVRLTDNGYSHTLAVALNQDVRLNANQLLKGDSFYELTVTCSEREPQITISDAKEISRGIFDAALNEYTVTP
ncbi:hypothetical protein E1L24_22235 [Salmonella enterica subsp. enterica serovar Braenderup]|nr:hypothetical protein [Salmonella enterica subsp. enterica serovar Braenderup]